MVNRPEPRNQYRRFSDCSVSEKLLDSFFLILAGIAYLFGMAYLYTTHSSLDGKPGLSMTDIVYTYYGNRSGTVLEGSIRGEMAEYATIKEQDSIVKWIYNDTKEEEFEKVILPILEKKCIRCHSEESEVPEKDLDYLTTYEEVMEGVEVDIGMSIGSLLRISHIHLFGLTFLLFLIGKIFILCNIPVWLKRVVVAIPFIAILMDIGSWWLTKFDPLFAYTVMIGGGLMGVSIAFQILLSLYQMWFYKYQPSPENP